MCVVSMVGDHFSEKYKHGPIIFQPPGSFGGPVPVSRDEFEALKKDVLHMKDLLKRAKLYDEQNGQPNCHMDEKIELLRKVAEAVGVSWMIFLLKRNDSRCMLFIPYSVAIIKILI